MINMAEALHSRLLALADELLIGIVEHVESKHDLCNLALTCSRLQVLAEPALYRSILVRKGTSAIGLFDAILGRPIRATFISELQIRYQHTHTQGIRILNHGLRTMRNLQCLTIETPCCNDTNALVEGFECKGEIDYAEYFAFASSMTLEAQPRVQVPLQTCKFALISVPYLLFFTIQVVTLAYSHSSQPSREWRKQTSLQHGGKCHNLSPSNTSQSDYFLL
jgi:F-box-like